MMNDLNPGWEPQSEPFLIGEFEVDATTHCVSRDGVSTKLEPKAMALLLYLAQRPGSVVSREELEREVWRDMVVGYDALNNSITKLRKAFNDKAKNPKVIQTVPKAGYRLIAKVGVSPTSMSASLSTTENEPDPSLERKLTAILYADVVDYSKLTGLDEEGTHHRLTSCLDLMTAAIDRYYGDVVHFAGDAILAEFGTASNALSCAATVQKELADQAENTPDDRKMQFRIGVNLGEVIVDRGDIYGDGVNVAARLEALAEPGGICLSGTVFDAIGHKLPLEYSFLGERRVKNIDKPVRAYQAQLKPGITLPPPPPKQESAGTIEKLKRRAPAVALALAGIMAIVALTWLQPWQGPETGGASNFDSPSIAVLPFENVSDDPAQEFFSDGITGDLITDLSKVSGLAVIARHSVFAYKDKATPLDRIAQELGVRYLLEGNIRRFGGKIRINVSLIDTRNSQSIWSERYDGDESDLFDLHGRVIDGIAAALAVELTDQEQTLFERSPTDNLEAYDYYLRAEQRRLIYSNWAEAIELYRKAIALDPAFAAAYAGLAKVGFDVWSTDDSEIMPAAAARKLAYDSAGKVRLLDPESPDAYSMLALLQATDGQHEIALESSQRAIKLSPNNADAYAIRSQVLTYTGRHEEALTTIKKAFLLNPKPPAEYFGLLGRTQFFNKQYVDAAASLAKIQVEVFRYKHDLMMSYAQLGRQDEAKAVLDGVLESMPFLNISYYKTRFAHYKNQQDLDHMIDAFRKAGVPENAFGQENDPTDRLDAVAVAVMVNGTTWRGTDGDGTNFIQQTTADGRVAFRNAYTLLVGTAWAEDDNYCIQFESAMLGRADCGHIYRNPKGNPDQQNEYVRAAVGAIYYFSVE